MKGRFKKETHLTANINKLVMQSDLFNGSHGVDRAVGSALQSSLLGGNRALVGRIEADQIARSQMRPGGAYAKGSVSPSPGSRTVGVSPGSPRITPPGTPQRSPRKGNAVHPSPVSFGSPLASSQVYNSHSNGNIKPASRPVISRLQYSERELVAH